LGKGTSHGGRLRRGAPRAVQGDALGTRLGREPAHGRRARRIVDRVQDRGAGRKRPDSGGRRARACCASRASTS
jgi:hypothetical protein